MTGHQEQHIACRVGTGTAPRYQPQVKNTSVAQRVVGELEREYGGGAVPKEGKDTGIAQFYVHVQGGVHLGRRLQTPRARTTHAHRSPKQPKSGKCPAAGGASLKSHAPQRLGEMCGANGVNAGP